jgi:hypothetical protein
LDGVADRLAKLFYHPPPQHCPPKRWPAIQSPCNLNRRLPGERSLRFKYRATPVLILILVWFLFSLIISISVWRYVLYILKQEAERARSFEVLSGQIPRDDLLRGILCASLLHILAYASVLGFLVSQPLLAMAQARETARVIVPGTDPGWTRIAVVPTNTVIQVRAIGTVKFGGFSTTDTASAGVENNPFIQRLKMLLRGNQPGEQINSRVRDPTIEDFRRTSRQVNFSQGGVWIKIVTFRAHNELMPANLYYYWDKFYNDAHLKFPVPVEVYAKVHDGGRLPEGRRPHTPTTWAVTRYGWIC